MTTHTLPGYDVAAVENWIRAHVPGLTPPLRWTRLEGGHSNLTYRVVDGQGRGAVIRRPPEGELLPKAHDMGREWALIRALGATPVPVPAALGFCEDVSVTGANFYLMGLVEGGRCIPPMTPGAGCRLSGARPWRIPSSMYWPICTQSIPMRSAWAIWARRTATSPGS